MKWHFSPSRVPHFGGLWEAVVRNMKSILSKILGPHILNFEELSTILAEASATLNSRPLLQIDSTDEHALAPLTPGHFLIGRPLKAPPIKTNTDSKLSLLKRLNLIYRIIMDIWTFWRSRYLQTLQARAK